MFFRLCSRAPSMMIWLHGAGPFCSPFSNSGRGRVAQSRGSAAATGPGGYHRLARTERRGVSGVDGREVELGSS